MKVLRALVPALVLMLLAAGCSDLSVFSPSNEGTVAVEVRSLHEGGVIGPGESLSFVIHGNADAQEDLQLEIILTDDQGDGVWRRTLSDPAVNEELELVLPDLQTGQYEILLQVMGTDSAASRKSLSFFYVQGRYAITGLSSYPPSTLPGAEIVVQTDLEVPNGADPYIRWTQGDAVLARGLLSEGLETITWKAPREPGVYPVTVELFPVPPSGSEDFSFSSALAMTARLYISPGVPTAADTLVPEASYYSLFHFDGSLNDRGRLGTTASGESQATGELFGDAEFASGASSDGLSIRAGSGMRYPRLILPLSGTEGPAGQAPEGTGSLAPCTLTLALVPDVEPREAALLTTRSADGGFGLIVRFDAQGSLVATLRSADEAVVDLPSGMPALSAGKLQRVDLSLVVLADTVTALWFLDGRQTAALARVLPLKAVGAAGEAGGDTVLGGTNGFAGTVTELGVYFEDDQGRPAVDPGIFRSAMQERFGLSLILAEGFEGLYPPSGFELQGRPALEKGALVLRPGPEAGEPSAAVDSPVGPAGSISGLKTPLFELRLPEIIIELQTRTGFPAGSRIVFQWEGEEDGFAELRCEGGTPQAFGSLLDPRVPGGALRLPRLPAALRIRLSSSGLTVEPFEDSGDDQAPSVTLPIGASPEGSSWLRLSLFGAPQAGPLELDHVLIYGASER